MIQNTLVYQPAVKRPIILQPATDVCTTGITSDNSPSNTLEKKHAIS